jgi:hypothetical protein
MKNHAIASVLGELACEAAMQASDSRHSREWRNAFNKINLKFNTDHPQPQFGHGE